MSDRKLFSLEELAEGAGVQPGRIAQLEELGLLAPSGRTETGLPYYEAEKNDELTQVLGLFEMGYEAAEIRKIQKKVGLPGGKRGKKIRTAGYLTVGELAEKTEVGARTIKHWEDKGILQPDTRSEGGFRLYNRNYVFFVELIKDLQIFGYKLEEIKEISDLFRLYMDLKSDQLGESPEANLERLETITLKIKEFLAKTSRMKKGIRRWEKLLEDKRREISRLKERYRRASADPSEANLEPVPAKSGS